MFYLNILYQSFKENILRASAFSFFTFLLVFGFAFRIELQKTIDYISPEKMVHPTIALMSHRHLDSKIMDKMNRLPGVESIEALTQEEMMGKVQRLVSSLGSDYQIKQELMDIEAFKIILNPKLSFLSHQFVKEKIEKYAGQGVTVSDVRYPEVTKQLQTHPFFGFLKKMGSWGIIGLILCCWIVSYQLYIDQFRARTYLIERFQRRQMVAAKSLGLLFLAPFLLSLVIAWSVGAILFLEMFLLTVILSIGWSFSLKEWQWKSTR